VLHKNSVQFQSFSATLSVFMHEKGGRPMRKWLRNVLPLVFLVVITLDSVAQSKISTFAGPELPISGLAATQPIDGPYAIVSDFSGGFYIASYYHNRIYHVLPAGIMEIVAGSSFGFSGDGGPATSAQFRGISAIVADPSGNIYIADTNNHRVRRVAPGGIIQTIAGNGIPGFSGDGGPATSAQLQFPSGIAISGGNVFIADKGNNRVRILTTDGRINTLVGTGVAGSSGDGGAFNTAQVNQPVGLAIDRQGNLLIGESAGHRVRRIVGGIINTIAGNGTPGYGGDGGLGSFAQINRPMGLAVDSGNNLYIADTGNHRIRRVSIATGLITLVAGTGTQGYAGDGGSPLNAQFDTPIGVGLDQQDTVYVADTENHRLRVIVGDVILTVFGNGTKGFSGEGGFATLAQLNAPRGVAMDASGNLYIADSVNNRIRQVGPFGAIFTYAGTGAAASFGDGFNATAAGVYRPQGVAVDAAGTLYIAETLGNRIRKVDPSTKLISNVAGFGSGGGFGGDGDLAVYARLNQPRSLALDSSGNIYIADSLNHRIRRIGADGRISTFAGTGFAAGTGDGGPAGAATLNTPSGVAVDASGNVYIADTGNRRIRKVTTSGIIFTVAGTSGPGVVGTNGDGSGATAPTALLSTPTGVAVDSKGNIFISEVDTGRVRVVTADGIIRTAVGVGVNGFSGDGGAGPGAQLNSPEGITVDSKGVLYVADTGSHRVRKVTDAAPPAQGQIFAISSRGGLSLSTVGNAPTTTVGYGRVQSSDLGLGGIAIFSYRPNNVLISEAAVPATRTLTTGRIYAYIGGEVVGNRPGVFVNTGVAIANPNDSIAQVSFSFTGSANSSGVTTIPANGQIAAFLTQAPFNAGSSFDGTFTFTSSVPVAVTALRGISNQRGEFLVTTLPVAELKTTAGPVFIPYFADGGGWATQIALINPTDSSMQGSIQFFDQLGNPIEVTANNQTGSTFSYSIRAREAFRLITSGLPPTISLGSIRIIPSAATPSPTGVAIFSFQQGDVTVTEAGVPTIGAGTAFRMYAEASGNFASGQIGSIQSGIAITNLTAGPAALTVTLDRLDGSSTGLTGTLIVPANGQISTFLNQIPGLTGLTLPFKGVLRIASGSSISVVGLRGRYNERNEFLITTTPPIDEAAVPPFAELVFPHFADSGGYTTQFILLAGPSSSATGSLRTFSQSGEVLNLNMQ
jgi:trimeric autotransporter adhesin